MLLLHQLCVPLPEALVETSVTWLDLRSGDNRIGRITQIALIADEVSSPLPMVGNTEGGERRAYGGAVWALTEIVSALLPRSSLRSYRERVRALTEIAEAFLPRAPLRSRYVRFRLLGTSDTEEVVWAISSWFVLSGGGRLVRADA